MKRLAASLLLVATHASTSSADTGFLDRSVTVAGETYLYQVYVPRDWSNKQKWPVILFLPGAKMDDADRSTYPYLSAPDPFSALAALVKDIPIWLFHGDADATVPVDNSRRLNAALTAAGAKVRYTEYPGVNHNSWDAAFAEAELMPWLLSQKRASH